MKYIITLVFLSLFAFSLQGQQVQDLLQQLETAPDTVKVNIYEKLLSKMSKTNTKKALEYGKKGIALAQKLKHTAGEASMLHNIGIIYMNLGSYSEGIKCFFKSLELNQTLGRTRNLASSYSSVGVVYAGLSNFAEAIKYFSEALTIYKELNDVDGFVSTLNNLASMYVLQKKFDDALKLFLKNEIVRKEMKDTSAILSAWNNIGQTYYELKAYKSALKYHEQQLALAKTYKDEANIMTAIRGIAQAKKALKKIDKELITSTRKSLELAQNRGEKDQVQETAKTLSGLYEAQKKYKDALKYHKLAMRYKDSVKNKVSQGLIAKQLARYRFRQQKKHIIKQEKTIQKKQEDLESQRSITYLLLVALLVVLLVAYGLFSFNKLRQKHFKSQLETKIAEGETRLLRAQMNPHFIFNSLNAIQSFIMMNNERMANSYLSRFSKLMRLFLESSRSQYTTIADEMELLDHYIKLEQLRFEDKFDYTISIDEEIDTYNTEIPTMIIQPFIENAINHGFIHKPEKGFLEIAFRKEGEEISCVVEDNGIGRQKAGEFKKQLPQQHVSRAMQIIEERLDLINTIENTNIGTTISDKFDSHDDSTGTRVEIRVPLWE